MPHSCWLIVHQEQLVKKEVNILLIHIFMNESLPNDSSMYYLFYGHPPVSTIIPPITLFRNYLLMIY